jgi:GNAT superfamily N-acetyltransferase
VPGLAAAARSFAEELRERHRPNLTEEAATRRFHEWLAVNPEASPRAQGDQLESLLRFYRFDRQSELAVLALLRSTVLAGAGEAVREACDRLLQRLFRHPGLRAMRCVELGDLQSALDDAAWREVLARLVFPPLAGGAHPAVQTVGDRAREHVVLQTECRDLQGASYRVREPRDAAEMGRIYREFLRARFPLQFSDEDRHLVLVDADEQLVGGVVWRLDPAGEPHLDGVVVSSSLRGRGLARRLLGDLALRLAAEGHHVLRTHYSLRGFFQGMGFDVDQQRGGLVRRLEPVA